MGGGAHPLHPPLDPPVQIYVIVIAFVGVQTYFMEANQTNRAGNLKGNNLLIVIRTDSREIIHPF